MVAPSQRRLKPVSSDLMSEIRAREDWENRLEEIEAELRKTKQVIDDMRRDAEIVKGRTQSGLT